MLPRCFLPLEGSPRAGLGVGPILKVLDAKRLEAVKHELRFWYLGRIPFTSVMIATTPSKRLRGTRMANPIFNSYTFLADLSLQASCFM